MTGRSEDFIASVSHVDRDSARRIIEEREQRGGAAGIEKPTSSAGSGDKAIEYFKNQAKV